MLAATSSALFFFFALVHVKSKMAKWVYWFSRLCRRVFIPSFHPVSVLSTFPLSPCTCFCFSRHLYPYSSFSVSINLYPSLFVACIRSYLSQSIFVRLFHFLCASISRHLSSFVFILVYASQSISICLYSLLSTSICLHSSLRFTINFTYFKSTPIGACQAVQRLGSSLSFSLSLSIHLYVPYTYVDLSIHLLVYLERVLCSRLAPTIARLLLNGGVVVCGCLCMCAVGDT